MFGRLGTGELVLILILALLFFGPSKLPEIGRSLGEGIRAFKDHSNKISQEMAEVVQKVEEKK